MREQATSIGGRADELKAAATNLRGEATSLSGEVKAFLAALRGAETNEEGDWPTPHKLDLPAGATIEGTELGV